MEERIKKDDLIAYLSELHPDAKCALHYNSDFSLLFSIILSAQTTDTLVNEVTPELFDKYSSIHQIANADIGDVERIIHRIGFYHNKAKNLVLAAQKLDEMGYRNIPDDYSFLLSLPGVGNKTASVFLAEYYGENRLGVDTHIARVAKRLSLAEENDDPDEISLKLSSYIGDYPARDFHHLMIDFGRHECNAKKPECVNCRIRSFCKYGHSH